MTSLPVSTLNRKFWELHNFAQIENLSVDLKLTALSFKSSLKRGGTRRDILPNPFPVLEATYEHNFSIFEISGQN